MAAFWRKYNVATASGTHIGIPMPKAGSRDFAVSADWTPATGDVKLSKDAGAEANIGTLPAYTNGHWIFQLTAGELSCKSLRVKIVDAATKAVDDNEFIVETYGDSSALHPFDLGIALSTQVVSAVGDKGDGLFDVATDSLQAIRDRGDAAWVATIAINTDTAAAGAASTITLGSTASTVNSFYVGAGILLTGGTGAGQERIITAYVGATKVATVDANWITNPDATSTYEIGPGRSYAATGSITTVTGNVNGSVASVTTVSDKTGYALSNAGVDALYTRALTEAYSADGAAPTVAQALFLIMQYLTEASVSTTTMTIKKLDGSTTAATLTLNDATTPTSKTRAS